MSKTSPFNYEVNNKSRANPEILLYGYIGQYDEFDYPRFQNTFREAIKDNKNLTMRVHCGGGSVFEGLAIYDLMRASSCKVHVIVEGMAASMGAILAVAGDTIEMTESAFFMMHAVKGVGHGDKKHISGQIELMENCEKRISAIFAERTNATTELITDWFNNGKDNWLSAEECLDLKLCDKIIKPSKKRKDTGAQASITNKTEMEAWELLNKSVGQPKKSNDNNEKSKQMKKQLISMLMLSGLISNSITEETADREVEGELAKVIAKAKSADAYKTQLEDLNNATATSLVENAVQAGKIMASEKEEWLKDAKANPGMAARAFDRMTGKPDPNNGLKRQPKKENTDQHALLNGREEWDFEKWQQEDPKGLAKLHGEAEESWKELFNQNHNA